jgi:hypothetical protein
MKKNASIFLLAIIFSLTFLAGCRPVSIYTQRATATAYAADYMTTAMQAAEDGALALCNIDFDSGEQAYVDQLCANSTTLGCQFFTDQLKQSWSDLKRAYTADTLVCIPATSRFLEEGEQFGMRVQYWQVTLKGTRGWPEGSQSRSIGCRWQRKTAIGS